MPTASEYRAWILFYSLPVLQEILPQPYYQHMELLVCSIHILLGDCITPTDLSLAEDMLEEYCRDFEKHYGNC